MKENWIKVSEKLPEDGQEVLTYYFDRSFGIKQFGVFIYHKKGSVIGSKLYREGKTPQDNLIKNILESSEIIAEEDGFYFLSCDENGDALYIKHADIITHWQPLVEPTIQF